MIVYIDSKRELQKTLKHLRDDYHSTIFIVMSNIIKRKHFPKDATVRDFGFLIAPSADLQIYLMNGDKDAYEIAYRRHIWRPEIQYNLTSTLLISEEDKRDVYFVCSEDEQMYEYMKLFSRALKHMYGIKMVSAKKYRKGKAEDTYSEKSGYIPMLMDRIQSTVPKLKELDFDPVHLMFKTIYKEDWKRLPKDMKKLFQPFIEARKCYDD